MNKKQLDLLKAKQRAMLAIERARIKSNQLKFDIKEYMRYKQYMWTKWINKYK